MLCSDLLLFFRVTTRTIKPFLATPGGGKDAKVIETLTVAEGVRGKVTKVENTPPGTRCGSGVTMWSTASLILRTAVMRVC